MTTAIIVALAVYSAAMTYLKATASKTKTTVDDKILAAGEKILPIIDFLRVQVEAEAKKAAVAKEEAVVAKAELAQAVVEAGPK